MSLVEALLKPEAYEEKVEKVEMLQTHISWVFLTGSYVYKVKKPVDFEFLNFTTLEKRKFYCEEEVRLNKRLCGDMYAGVVPITKSGGVIKVGGTGEVVEYAVKMRQLPQDAIMTTLLRKNAVLGEDIDRIAKLLTEFHSKAATGKGVDDYGSVRQIEANWIQNFEQTRNLRGGLIDKKTFDFIENNVLKFMERKIKLFEERVAEGRIRECHGDVHSGNIFIIRGLGRGARSANDEATNAEIYIFDAIEFNRAFSCSDVAAEVAFLAMDLDFHRRSDLSERFVDKYIQYSGDKKLLKLLDFYKCYRAYVRAKVASFRLGDEHATEKEKAEAEALVEKYFKLAYEYAKQI